MHVRSVYYHNNYFVYRYGPLLRHWTMRYEAKHNHFKKLAQNVGNFINVAWTLVSRHQYWQCLQFMDKDCLRQDTTEVGPGMFTLNNTRIRQ